MEGKKLDKKIRDWASDLSYKLPDGSAPPANYFALLTATPHRRQLWEALIELVHPRQKVEYMRKQIMVAKIRNRNNCSAKHDSASAPDRIDLWHKQTILENQIKEKGNEMMRLEGITLAKVSDMLYEICKLAELEKFWEESSEKALALKLFTKRENSVITCLEKILLEGAGNSSEYFETCGNDQDNLDAMKNELLHVEECKSTFGDSHDCKLGNKLKGLWKCGISDGNVWEEVVRCKDALLTKVALLLEELDRNEKSVFREKEMEIENSLSASVLQLKQRATAKALKAILNSNKGQALDWKIKKMEEVLYEGEPAASVNESFAAPISSLAADGTRDSFLGGENATTSVGKCVSSAGLRCYKEWLEKESRRLGGVARVEGDEGCQKAENELPSFDSVVEEIRSKRSKEREVAEEIFRSFNRLDSAMRSLREEAEEKKKAGALQDADTVARASGQLVDAFMDTPSDAFRTVQSCSGRLSFECESLSHCLTSYGGELKQFFSAMLIPPRPEATAVLAEVEARRKVSSQVRNAIRRRHELARLQRGLQERADSMTLDTRLCEGNFQESAAILWNVSVKSDELMREADFIEGILRNWVEQPYRWMAGKT